MKLPHKSFFIRFIYIFFFLPAEPNVCDRVNVSIIFHVKHYPFLRHNLLLSLSFNLNWLGFEFNRMNVCRKKNIDINSQSLWIIVQTCYICNMPQSIDFKADKKRILIARRTDCASVSWMNVSCCWMNVTKPLANISNDKPINLCSTYCCWPQ